ncbi:aldehyde dehydrogenase family protein [Streptomyces sp. NPDC001914]|uniref:aldehyde dehydrogenase family protein n=1 Tax=Streptomyces sp. NPDC001914 TaxID=3364623 RepID=UPI003674CA05
MTTRIADSEKSADEVLTGLAAAEAVWARTGPAQRRDLLNRVGDLVARHADEWIAAAVRIKGLEAGSPLVGEEWISGPWAVVGSARALAATHDRIARGEDPLGGAELRPAPGGRIAVPALPASNYDRLLLSGFSADVWMRPGVTAAEIRDEAGLAARDTTHTRGTTLVLGAGNIFSIAPLDVLYALHADNRVVVLKLNPVTDPLLQVFRKVLAPYTELGVLEIVTGGAGTGSAYAYDPRVTSVHMTGSEATHDAIVWGVGEEGERARAAGTPKLDKPISSELGGVAPVIVVPGRWSAADLRFQAQHVATQRLHNSGANCIAAQVVLVSADWPQKDAFLAELRRALDEAPARPVWYPGGTDRVAAARDTHGDRATSLGPASERLLIQDLDAGDADEPAFRTEYFAPVLTVAELPGEGSDFLAEAVRTANDGLRGTLGANIVIHPATLRALGPFFDEQLAELRYGTIGVNAWTGVGYLTPHATWGAFPGHPLEDIQSGRGVVHNAFLLAQVERTVVRGPFRASPRSLFHGEWSLSPKPPWFVSNRTAATTGRRLTAFQARPRITALPCIFASALRG